MSRITLQDTGATFSPCRTWRYTLWRIWDRDRKPMVCVGLNPSTADETHNDPTVTRVMNHAHTWGYGGLIMTNLYAYRSTDPNRLKGLTHEERVGPDNAAAILLASQQSGLMLAAWGMLQNRYRTWERELVNTLTSNGVKLHCLGLTKDGSPRHPLYMRRDVVPLSWRLP